MIQRYAHRGLVQYAPENTLGAFEAAVDFGCEGIELDIRLSKDGVPVVVHDDHLFRMTDGAVSESVSELTLKELKDADIIYAGHLLPYDPPVPYSENRGSTAHFKAEKIAELRAKDKRVAHLMTFEELDRWFAGVKKDITIEVEFCTGGLAEPVYDILSRSSNCGRYILFSGNRSDNDELQTLMRKKGKPAGLRLGANIRRLTEETKEFVNSADLYEVGLNDFWFTAEDSRYLAERGIKVFSNLGDYPEWWSAMPSLGVTAFKTNYAEAYTDWAKKI